MALVVNLYGGPGISKSTTAALVFGKLKARGFTAELATEFAKDLTWEGRSEALQCQPYVLGKQLFRIERVRGKVGYVITDSPILLCQVYGEGWGSSFLDFVKDAHDRMKTINILLERNNDIHAYVPEGRNQNYEEACEIDRKVELMLFRQKVDFRRLAVEDADTTAERVVELLMEERDARLGRTI